METAVIERIERYIKDTKISEELEDSYCMRVSEIRAIWSMLNQDPYHAVCVIFAFGRAKGYRAAKSKMKENIT